MSDDRGLIDTSVAVDIGKLNPAQFPTEVAISALTLAELVTGLHAASDDLMRARRLSQLQYVEANVETLPFDSNCGRAYGQIYVPVVSIGRKPRGPRMVDLMIASTALANDLPLYTRNAKDLRGLEDLIKIVDVSS